MSQGFGISGVRAEIASATSQVASGRVDDLKGDLARVTTDEAAEKLESLFATILVKELRRALPDGFFGDGTGADTYNAWLDEHVGDALAKSGDMDLAGMIKTALNRKSAEA